MTDLLKQLEAKGHKVQLLTDDAGTKSPELNVQELEASVDNAEEKEALRDQLKQQEA